MTTAPAFGVSNPLRSDIPSLVTPLLGESPENGTHMSVFSKEATQTDHRSTGLSTLLLEE
jgi:hypothetical protein